MAKPPAKKSPLLKKCGSKCYTKSQLMAHLAEAVGDVSKKQAAAFVNELVKLLIEWAPVGASVPGLGKLVLKKTPARPARMGRNPATGEEIQIPAKKAGKKLVFRVNKKAKLAAGL